MEGILSPGLYAFDSIDSLKIAMKQDEAFSSQFIKDNYAE